MSRINISESTVRGIEKIVQEEIEAYLGADKKPIQESTKPSVVLSESSQVLIEQLILSEAFNGRSADEIFQKLRQYAAIGAVSLATLMGLAKMYNMSEDRSKEIYNTYMEHANKSNAEDDYRMCVQDPVNAAHQGKIQFLSNNVIGTVYNLTKAQCKDDLSTSASNFKLNQQTPEDHRIVAVERTFMKALGLKWGDVIFVQGSGDGEIDGFWQVQDTMNKRFAGQKKIDFLVRGDRKHGMWKDLTIWKVLDKNLLGLVKKDFLPENE